MNGSLKFVTLKALWTILISFLFPFTLCVKDILNDHAWVHLRGQKAVGAQWEYVNFSFRV